MKTRLLSYIELMKPELTSLSVLTSLCGFYLATKGTFNLQLFIATALGTLFIGGGAGTLNEYIERNYDALMKRTEKRPLPSGKLQPLEALVFGTVISILGMFLLTFFVNPLTGFLAFITFTTYLFLYTPLKRISPMATIIGGIPGALPPMMGWTAVRNSLSVEAWVLFAILFCWQMPHFFSLAWMYKKDYARAGFKMLTVLDHDGTKTSRQILFYSLALIPASLIMTSLRSTGSVYFVGALILGLLFFAATIPFVKYSRTPATATQANFYSRRIFFASLAYLPALLLLMSFDKV